MQLNIQKASLLLDAYEEIFLILRRNHHYEGNAFISQKFWRVANRYYNSRRSWAQRILPACWRK